MFELALPERLPACGSPIDLLTRMVWPSEKLLSKDDRWKAAVWQMMVNHLAITQPELGLPAVEVVRVGGPMSWRPEDGKVIAAVRPVQSPQTELVLVYLCPENAGGQKLKPRLICRRAVGSEFNDCCTSLASYEPLNGTQLFAIATRVRPIKHNWSGTNAEYAQDWLNAYNAQVDDPQQLPVERFTLVGVARSRDYHSSYKWRVAHIRSERSGIDMVLDFSYGTNEEIVCRPPMIGELGWSTFSATS